MQGFCLSFLTQLDRSSHPLVQKLVCQHILLGNSKCLKQVRLQSDERLEKGNGIVDFAVLCTQLVLLQQRQEMFTAAQ